MRTTSVAVLDRDYIDICSATGTSSATEDAVFETFDGIHARGLVRRDRS
ncbi:hypothetical protein [Stigmatella erecta]|nr:hypothetical protein [Stigmatella erecta]